MRVVWSLDSKRPPVRLAPNPSQTTILVVDLDHTLVRTDLLHESVLDALVRAPLSFISATLGLRAGKAVFKARLADVASIDVATLPYNGAVLAQIEAVRREGGRTVLVSATNERLVLAVAAHLGCFDEAHGSDDRRNLRGDAKAQFLVDRYGAGKFDYVGNGVVDLPVWRHARRVVTVGVSDKVRAKVRQIDPEAVHLSPPENRMAQAAHLLGALRPHQWLKNLLVFLPIIAGHRIDPGAWMAALTAFAAFSMTASSAYVINDLLDLSADRVHPRKRRRPFASGALPISHGVPLVFGLLAGAGLLSLLARQPLLVLILALYAVSTMAYSLVLKRQLMIDICTLSGLYTLRVVAGSVATGVPLSPWMCAFSAFLFLSLAAVKRQTELVDGLGSGRAEATGRAYVTDDLPIVAMMAISSGYIAVLVLALYVSSPAVDGLYHSPLILWGACPVLFFWISRLVMLAHRGALHHDPVVFAARDPVSLLCGAGVVLVALAATFW
jgi:4-hydroxybenzoate polyprenyltransferase/phosphoserine phosphatase